MVSKTDLLQKTSEYMDYISEHKKNIQKAWDEIRNATIGISLLQRPAILDEMSWRIKNHDDSKFSEEEFVPYRQHFYPVDGEDVDPAAFDRAWRTHYRRNDHHWQYWVDEDGDFISSYSVDNKICAYLEWYVIGRPCLMSWAGMLSPTMSRISHLSRSRRIGESSLRKFFLFSVSILQ